MNGEIELNFSFRFSLLTDCSGDDFIGYFLTFHKRRQIESLTAACCNPAFFCIGKIRRMIAVCDDATS